MNHVMSHAKRLQAKRKTFFFVMELGNWWMV
jgi:hypothetical protein